MDSILGTRIRNRILLIAIHLIYFVFESHCIDFRSICSQVRASMFNGEIFGRLLAVHFDANSSTNTHTHSYEDIWATFMSISVSVHAYIHNSTISWTRMRD